MTSGAYGDCSFVEPSTGTREQFSYLDVGDDGAQLYVVHHQAQGSPRGGVVLCGPIGAERERGYRTLVEIARAVAADGFDALRFDYRGIGESTGRFEDYCLSDWRKDIEACVKLSRDRLRGRPLGLWGARAGALLASEVFGAGFGDGLMLCAPLDGQPHLIDILRRSLVADMLARPNKRRATREEFVSALERGELVNIDGYLWSRRLWQDASAHRVSVPVDNVRPWQVIDYRGSQRNAREAEHDAHWHLYSAGRFWEGSPTLLPTTLRDLTERTIGWLRSMQPRGAM